MTRDERLKKLQALSNSIPICDLYCMEAAFIPWQGQVSALLSFNPKLQQDFQGAASSVHPNPFNDESLDTMEGLRKANGIIRRIIAQAMSELELPEEKQAETPLLTDEHGAIWFFAHSTKPVRWKLLFLIASVAAGGFGAGLGLGQIEPVRSWYIQWKSPQIPQPTTPPMKPEPTAQPSSTSSPVSDQ
ncbi:MAG: hypothetical protein ABR611_15300 [Chthoniobacterales bacterium]